MKVNDYFDKVIVINLDRRTDRMDKLVPQLEKLDIQYKRFSAVDGKKLDIDPIVAGLRSHLLTTGSQAYCINPSRLEYFISKLEDYNSYIDIGLRDFAKDLKAYITQPNLVVQFPSYSDLRLKEVDDF
jgi:hypothetical protein